MKNLLPGRAGHCLDQHLSQRRSVYPRRRPGWSRLGL